MIVEGESFPSFEFSVTFFESLIEFRFRRVAHHVSPAPRRSEKAPDVQSPLPAMRQPVPGD